MGRSLGRQVCGKWFGANEFVSETPVERQQLVTARANDAQVHHAGTRLAREILRRGYQLPANSGSLAGRLHGEKAQIAAVVAGLDENPPRHSARIFRYKKRAAAHVRAHAQVIDAIAVEDDLLDDEGGVDQFRERFDVVVRSLADTDISRA